MDRMTSRVSLALTFIPLSAPGSMSRHSCQQAFPTEPEETHPVKWLWLVSCHACAEWPIRCERNKVQHFSRLNKPAKKLLYPPCLCFTETEDDEAQITSILLFGVWGSGRRGLFPRGKKWFLLPEPCARQRNVLPLTISPAPFCSGSSFGQ